VRAFEDGLLATLRGQHADLLEAIRSSKDLSDDSASKLKGIVEDFTKAFA
jgi:F-type H+-transporting ATPase subunit alpha